MHSLFKLGANFLLGLCVYPTKNISGVFSTVVDCCSIAPQVLGLKMMAQSLFVIFELSSSRTEHSDDPTKLSNVNLCFIT